MTPVLFWTIFWASCLIVSVIGILSYLYLEDSNTREIFQVIGIFLGILSIFCIFAVNFTEGKFNPVTTAYWVLLSVPGAYLLGLIIVFICENMIFPKERDYFESYYKEKHAYDNLKEKYNKLQKDFDNLEKEHQKELEDVIKHQPLFKFQSTNSKLYL